MSGGYPMFQFADGEIQTTCLISEGARDSQRRVEQKAVPQANVLTTVHCFPLKHSCDARVS